MPLSLSSLLSFPVSVLLAYQLRVCQPPPEVPNAVMLMEDGELEIGELSVCLWVPQDVNEDVNLRLVTFHYLI